MIGRNLKKGFSVKGGIMESEVGVGFEYLNKKLKINYDVFNPNNANLDFQAGYRFIPNVYLLIQKKTKPNKKTWIGVEIER
jgi:hypothetical protein